MTTPAQIRKAALALPDVVEVGKGVFEVRGVPFATLTPEKILRLEEQDDVALDEVNGMQSNALVRQAWFAAAPEDLAGRLHGIGPKAVRILGESR